jgi:DNA helicase HerA-like ATPase
MIKDGNILLGKAGDKEIYLYPNQMNRHGLIAGASGTGKTVTLKVIAESLSEIGVPSVIADVKGDLTGMIKAGDQTKIQERLDSMGITGFECRKYPVHFFDVYQKQGHPMRAMVQEMGPLLLSRIMGLSEAQEGVLNIIFKVAQDMNLDIIDLKDLQAMTGYVGEHAAEYTTKYGNVSKQSVGAIQRELLVLDQQGGGQFFGQPAIDINDWLTAEGGCGMMNILECEELFQHPQLYSTFLFWMMNELYEKMPEVGDLDKPKIVFFFDEAHLLFDNASKELLEKINQIIKLIRSKGVGIFFITQSPADIPDEVLAQLSNRIQHSLRAYTPAEIKATKLAAESFRANPAFNTADVITNMKTGHALVSTLGTDGAPSIVEETKILPPKSQMDIVTPAELESCIQADSIFGKYEKTVDADSAYEDLDNVRQQEAAAAQKAKEDAEQAKLDAVKAKEEARQKAKEEKAGSSLTDKIGKKVVNRAENEAVSLGFRYAKKFLKGFLK